MFINLSDDDIDVLREALRGRLAEPAKRNVGLFGGY